MQILKSEMNDSSSRRKTVITSQSTFNQQMTLYEGHEYFSNKPKIKLAGTINNISYDCY